MSRVFVLSIAKGAVNAAAYTNSLRPLTNVLLLKYSFAANFTFQKQTNMKQAVLLLTIAFFATNANGKVWRVNNTPGVAADFTNTDLAVASASVANGDTIHVEASVTAYNGFTLKKKLVFIGTGYFLGGANANTGLQANVNAAVISSIYIDTLCSGSQFMGLTLNVSPNFQSGTDNGAGTDNITFTRCNLNFFQTYGYTNTNNTITGFVFNKCYMQGLNLSVYRPQNCEFTNNIFTGSFDISNVFSLNNLVRNNVFRSAIAMYNGYFANNIITGTTFTLTNVTIRNNISTGTNLPVGSGNINSATDAALFQGLTANSTDGQWRLKAGSPAFGAGETVSAITPDCGAFGTADPYVLSGIPPIPTIYSLTVPASIATSATTMPITISTKSNN
jgi:hypothetical protein